ncbi:MAG: hypothetical protein WBG37_21690 [Desulfobacterales bacterium]
MKIQTSFFQRQKEVPFPVAISRLVPPDFRGTLYRKLAPTRELEEGLYKGRIDSELYVREYLKLLESRNLSPDIVVRELPFNCTLLCWERPYEFCHRHVVARWILNATGIEVKEYGSRFIKPGLGIS